MLLPICLVTQLLLRVQHAFVPLFQKGGCNWILSPMLCLLLNTDTTTDLAALPLAALCCEVRCIPVAVATQLNLATDA